jgi:hypothetical protein
MGLVKKISSSVIGSLSESAERDMPSRASIAAIRAEPKISTVLRYRYCGVMIPQVC